MATLWDFITSNSTLPVQPGNTFWDHLQNQKQSVFTSTVGGSQNAPPPVIYGETTVFVEEGISVVYDDDNINVLALEDRVILDAEESVDITNDL
jgi:hypothetical protein